jgi:hypothetical protein
MGITVRTYMMGESADPGLAIKYVVTLIAPYVWQYHDLRNK